MVCADKLAPRVNPDPAAGVAVEPKVNPEAAVVVGGAAFIPNVVVGAPKEKPPPAAVDFAGVPKLKPPEGLVVLWVWMDEPKVKPPPVAGVDVVSPKPVVGAGAEAVVFCVPKVKPEEGCPKVNGPLIFSEESASLLRRLSRRWGLIKLTTPFLMLL